MNLMDQKKNFLNLRQTVRFFESLMHTAADGVVITDAAQNIIFVNNTFCDFFSCSKHNLIETHISASFDRLAYGHPEHVKQWNRLSTQVQQLGIARDVEFRINTRTGTKYFAVNASLLEQTYIEEPGTIMSIWRDITGHRPVLRASGDLRMPVLEHMTLCDC